MGHRSILLALLIFLTGSLATFQLIRSVEGRAHPFPQIMYGLTAGVWLLLLLRLRITDRFLRRRLTALYRQHPEARTHFKAFLNEMSLDGRRLNRLRSLVRRVPHLFVHLLLLLLAVNVVLRLIALGHPFAPGSLAHIVFPWATLFGVCAFLLHNDIQLSKVLGAILAEIPPARPLATTKAQTKEAFIALLSLRQREIFDLRFGSKLQIKVIASRLYIAEVTVKTHLNDIFKVWRKYKEQQSLGEMSPYDLF